MESDTDVSLHSIVEDLWEDSWMEFWMELFIGWNFYVRP